MILITQPRVGTSHNEILTRQVVAPLKSWRNSMSHTDVPFDKEKFLNACPCGCSKSRQAILDGIEKYKDTDPEMVKYLGWHRDHLWATQVKEEEYRRLRRELGDDELNKKTAECLRAYADKLEEPGHHFMIFCDLPPMPIFSGKDYVEKYHSHIEVHMVAAPLGG